MDLSKKEQEEGLREGEGGGEVMGGEEGARIGTGNGEETLDAEGGDASCWAKGGCEEGGGVDE